MRHAFALIVLILVATQAAVAESVLTPVTVVKHGPDPADVSWCPFTPVVDDARVGDFVVVRLPRGYCQRLEVVEIDGDRVWIQHTDQTKPGTPKMVNGKPVTEKRCHWKKTEQEKTATAQKPGFEEVDVVDGGTAKLKIAGRQVECKLRKGYRSLGSVASNDHLDRMKITPFVQYIATDAPLGGVLKDQQAPDDGVPMSFHSGDGKPVYQKNTTNHLETMVEVVDFGRGQ
jgi:hypothetical protein